MSNRPEGQNFRQHDPRGTKPRKPVRDPEVGSDAGGMGAVLIIMFLSVLLTALFFLCTGIPG